jgi:hypothetical protein
MSTTHCSPLTCCQFHPDVGVESLKENILLLTLLFFKPCQSLKPLNLVEELPKSCYESCPCRELYTHSKFWSTSRSCQTLHTPTPQTVLVLVVMPSTGSAMNGHQNGVPAGYLDSSQAMEFLDSDYAHGDGLDAKSLMDSRVNGGLTYNDFLVLPGYIGMQPLHHKSPSWPSNKLQASPPVMSISILQSPSESRSRPHSFPRPWTPSPNTQWPYTWPCWAVLASSITIVLWRNRRRWFEMLSVSKMALF